MELFSNPLLKNIALKQLKKLMQENGLQSIVITIDENGEPKFDLFKANVVTENTQLKETISKFLNQ